MPSAPDLLFKSQIAMFSWHYDSLGREWMGQNPEQVFSRVSKPVGEWRFVILIEWKMLFIVWTQKPKLNVYYVLAGGAPQNANTAVLQTHEEWPRDQSSS